MAESLLNRVWRSIVGTAPQFHPTAHVQQLRMYQGAKQTYTTASFGGLSNTSADSELHSSLTTLRSRSRQLLRDAPYAKRACKVVVDNVIGAGIGMQAQVRTTRDAFAEGVNEQIETQWAIWCRPGSCHTGRSLHFFDLERMAMRQVFEAGEVFIRKHPRRFGESAVPFALEIIEAERLASEYTSPGPQNENSRVRLGVEVDRFGAPVAYWIREGYPGDLRTGPNASERVERVPADQIFHLRLIDRWPQTRGEPWLHAVLRKLNDMDGYSEAEIYAARAAANVLFSIESNPDDGSPIAPGDDPVGERQADGSDHFTVEPGLGMRLDPGQKLSMANPSRPNTALDPFMRYMLREVAAGTNISYESISRDFSQSNFSSSRLGVYEDRDAWRVLQAWWIRTFREPLHREWLNQAVLARAVRGISVEAYGSDRERYEEVKFKPRGWDLIDPAKDVPALKEAIKAGLMTRTHAIESAARGLDIEDIDTTRERELKAAKDKGLIFDTDPDVFAAPPPAPAPAPASKEPAEPPEPDESPAVKADREALRAQVNRIERQVDMQSILRAVPEATPVKMSIEPGAIVVNNIPPAVAAPLPLVVQDRAATEDEMDRRLMSEMVEFARTAIERAAPVIQVAAPTVNVAAPNVTVEAPIVQVAAPSVTVEPAQVTLEATLPAPQVHVAHPARAVVTHERDGAGELMRSITTYEAAHQRGAMEGDQVVAVGINDRTEKQEQ